jgi:hypothetical protein
MQPFPFSSCLTGNAEKRGAKGNRTPDLLNAIEALYQLSYDPVTDEGET